MKTYSDITIHHPFSSSVQKEKYLLSYNGQYYEASHAIVELVEELQRYEEEKAAIEAYVRKKEGKYTPEQVREVNSSIPSFVQCRKSGASFTKRNCSAPAR